MVSDSDIIERYQLGDAEAWASAERDGFLKDAFLPVRQFSEIAGRDKTYLCGRRGSGKSAIAIKLPDQSGFRYAKPIEGERSQYGAYLDIVRQLDEAKALHGYLDIKRAVQRLWMWVLPVVAMQLVVSETLRRAEPPDDDINEMEQYLKTLPDPLHLGSNIGQLLQTMFLKAFDHIESRHFDSFLVNLTASQEFTRAMEALTRKTRQAGALLVLDTLESYKIFAPYMLEGFRGILEAIGALRADERMSGVAIKFFLPAEIFEKASEGVPAKAMSGTVFMRWRAADIISLLAGRFLSVLGKNAVVPEKQLADLRTAVENAYKVRDGRHLRSVFWYDSGFLPRTVTNSLGTEEDCLAYMMRHTFRRPRDAIVQMQAIVDRSVESGEFPFISVASVARGVHDEQVLGAIVGDALSPFEGSVPVEVVTAAQSAFYGRSWVMTGRELKRFSKELYALHPVAEIHPDDFARLMMHAGCVGLVDEKASNRYRAARFEYMMASTLPVRDTLEYCVHPVMGDLFRMQEPDDGRPIYPMPEEDNWLETEAGINRK